MNNHKSKPVETSPDGRYSRLDEKLGQGAYKDVWKAIDTEEGIEVAWNTVNLARVPPAERKRLRGETELLNNIRHPNIITFYRSWEDKDKDQICFTTEIVTSGTLKEYTRKIPNLKLKVIKKWCRQILSALIYLHSQNPPIIHRDLKCDNIFINGSTGEIRIGDFGLSSRGYGQSVLGTPEFMAPELYDEKYSESVDIYAFGMCVLEMSTKKYPYEECTTPAQIYKRVTNGLKPEVFSQITDMEVRAFVELCLAPPLYRPSARDLIEHPFLSFEVCDPREMRVVELSEKATPLPSLFTGISRRRHAIEVIPEPSEGSGSDEESDWSDCSPSADSAASRAASRRNSVSAPARASSSSDGRPKQSAARKSKSPKQVVEASPIVQTPVALVPTPVPPTAGPPTGVPVETIVGPSVGPTPLAVIGTPGGLAGGMPMAGPLTPTPATPVVVPSPAPTTGNGPTGLMLPSLIPSFPHRPTITPGTQGQVGTASAPASVSPVGGPGLNGPAGGPIGGPIGGPGPVSSPVSSPLGGPVVGPSPVAGGGGGAMPMQPYVQQGQPLYSYPSSSPMPGTYPEGYRLHVSQVGISFPATTPSPQPFPSSTPTPQPSKPQNGQQYATYSEGFAPMPPLPRQMSSYPAHQSVGSNPVAASAKPKYKVSTTIGSVENGNVHLVMFILHLAADASGKQDQKRIRFTYDLNNEKDTPESVADEMIKAFGFPHDIYPAVVQELYQVREKALPTVSSGSSRPSVTVPIPQPSHPTRSPSREFHFDQPQLPDEGIHSSMQYSPPGATLVPPGVSLPQGFVPSSASVAPTSSVPPTASPISSVPPSVSSGSGVMPLGLLPVPVAMPVPAGASGVSSSPQPAGSAGGYVPIAHPVGQDFARPMASSDQYYPPMIDPSYSGGSNLSNASPTNPHFIQGFPVGYQPPAGAQYDPSYRPIQGPSGQYVSGSVPQGEYYEAASYPQAYAQPSQEGYVQPSYPGADQLRQQELRQQEQALQDQLNQVRKQLQLKEQRDEMSRLPSEGSFYGSISPAGERSESNISVSGQLRSDSGVSGVSGVSAVGGYSSPPISASLAGGGFGMVPERGLQAQAWDKGAPSQ